MSTVYNTFADENLKTITSLVNITVVIFYSQLFYHLCAKVKNQHAFFFESNQKVVIENFTQRQKVKNSGIDRNPRKFSKIQNFRKMFLF